MYAYTYTYIQTTVVNWKYLWRCTEIRVIWKKALDFIADM